MPIDHTGELLCNRRITGPGSWKTYHKRTAAGSVPYRERLWAWRCLDCGATGESRMSVMKRTGHNCKPLDRYAQHEREQPHVCTSQCEGCGHYRPISIGGHCCNYSTDVGHVRPKVDLRTESCPVRDPDFVPPNVKPVAIISNGQDILRRIAGTSI